MTSVVNVAVHSSQFPENIRRDLLASLRSHRLNHKFLYDSRQQVQKWLALHENHSPARRDMDCLRTYTRAFCKTATLVPTTGIHLLGLGCGGGQKEASLLKLLQAKSRRISFTATDVSVPMVLEACAAARRILPSGKINAAVFDLATAKDLAAWLLSHHNPQTPRIITFFGLIPNFEPQHVLPRLASLVRRRDWLLFSANLAPGGDYFTGMKRVLPQYDNPLTHDWLLSFLDELGVPRNAGRLKFTIETGGLGLKRFVARFHFARACRIETNGKRIEFRRGDSLRLFFSYRYSEARVIATLARYGLHVNEAWVSKSGEEGVFLCHRG